MPGVAPLGAFVAVGGTNSLVATFIVVGLLDGTKAATFVDIVTVLTTELKARPRLKLGAGVFAGLVKLKPGLF